MVTSNVKVIFEKVHNEAKAPTKATEYAACWDVYSVEEAFITSGKITIVDTGIKVKIPDGYEIVVRPRSGLSFKHGIIILNSPGTIDSDYRGNIKIALSSINEDHFGLGKYKKNDMWEELDGRYKINIGDRIAQIALKKLEKYEFIEGKVENDTVRAEKGFGSTGT
jgi:dUTP pyrophosphatase